MIGELEYGVKNHFFSSKDTKPIFCSRSEGGFFPHRAHSAESRGYSFDSGPLEISRHKRLLSPPGSPAHNIPPGREI